MKDNKRRRRKGRTPSGNTYADAYHERTKGKPGLRPLRPRPIGSKPVLAHEDIEPKQETRRDGVAEGIMVPKLRGLGRSVRPSWVVSLAMRMEPARRGKAPRRKLPFSQKFYPTKAIAA